jgi:hypothetical protein
MAMRFILTLGWYLILFNYCKEGGSYSQALRPMDGGHLKNAGAVFYRLLYALRQKRLTTTLVAKKRSSNSPRSTLF